MPHYLFKIQKGGQEPELIDVELDSVTQARQEAATLIGHEMKDYPDEFWTDGEWHVEVTDERGLILFTVFSSATEAALGFSR